MQRQKPNIFCLLNQILFSYRACQTQSFPGIGNGFPLAMAVTTPEIAEAFANSSLHFNTFGGNAIASAAGHATLKVSD